MVTEVSQPKKRNTLIIILVLIIALLVTFNFSQFINKNRIKISRQELMENHAKTMTELEAARSEFYKYMGINDQLDAVIKKANIDIEEKEQQIWQLASENKLKDAENKKLIFELDSIKEEYLHIIDSLLIQQHGNEALNSRIKELEAVVTNLNKKLGNAERLTLENIEIEAMKDGLGGRYQKTAMAKKTAAFSICFDVMANNTAPSGNTKLYVRIISPDAEVIVNSEKGSGTFIHPEHKIEVSYSFTDEFDYNNKSMHICTEWGNESNYKPGLYIAELYANNNKIGFSTFTLK
ncbi:MAG: hypothetical protein JXB49_12440 [Bacteroidales bacterium]|nr:hypothetical protein [Bacteroidales bacterium]